jgi:hypothetical protein
VSYSEFDGSGQTARYTFGITNITTGRGLDIIFDGSSENTEAELDVMMQELIDHLNQLTGWYVSSGRKTKEYVSTFTPTLTP